MPERKSLTGRFEPLVSILLIILAAVFAHLLLVHQFGIYRDSWFLMMGGYIDGPAKFFDIWSIDRPGVAYLFSGLYSLFGSSLLAYNLVAFTLRLTGALGLFWVLRIVWPQARFGSMLTALLFVVYPGFVQMPNALEYTPHLTSLALFIFSVALALKAFQSRSLAGRASLTIGSVLLTGLYLFLMEYYVGMEGLRLALLYLLVTRQTTGMPALRRLAAVGRAYAPYALAAAAFLYWRMFIFVNLRPSTDTSTMFGGFTQSPMYEVLGWLSTLIKDLFETVLLAWAVPPYQMIFSARLRDFIAAGFLGLAAAGILLLAMWFLSRRQWQPELVDESHSVQWGKQAALAGGFAVMLACIPASFSDLNVAFTSNFDRFTLPGSFGASLLMVGLIFSSGKTSVRRWLPALLLLTAVMTHHINGIHFANEWKDSRAIWWQLAWRAPQIQPGTMLLSDLALLPDLSGDTVWPVSLIYYPQPGPLQIASEVLDTGTAQNLLTGRSIPRDNRSFEMVYDYSQVLVLTRPAAGSCLQIMDGRAPEYSGSENFKILSIAAYSDLDRIDVNAPAMIPPARLFGEEPPHDWCYYYQKASLARQRGQWEEAAQLGYAAAEQGLRPIDRVEWVPFLLAYAYTGDYDSAMDLVPVVAEVLRIKVNLCTNLNFQELNRSMDEKPETISGRQFLLGALCQ
jgi:hypothetical protein